MIGLLRTIRNDLACKAARRYGESTRHALLKVLLADGTFAMVVYRLMQASHRQRLGLLAMVFNKINVIFGGCIIGRGADFGAGVRPAAQQRRRRQFPGSRRSKRGPRASGYHRDRRGGMPGPRRPCLRWCRGQDPGLDPDRQPGARWCQRRGRSRRARRKHRRWHPCPRGSWACCRRGEGLGGGRRQGIASVESTTIG